MNGLVKRLSENQHKLSPLERQVIDYIMENKQKVSSYKLEDFAKELFISTATISRSCRTLGFRGFQELKYSLQEIVKKEKTPEKINIKCEGLESHINRFQKEMQLTLQSIDYTGISEAVQLIKETNRIEFFGVANSLFPGQDAAKKLTLAGKLCNAKSDWDDLYTTANSLREEDLAILISFSGETPRIIEFANMLKYKKAKIIVITGPQRNSLMDYGDVCLSPYITNYRYEGMDMTSRYPISIVLDLIILQFLNEMN